MIVMYINHNFHRYTYIFHFLSLVRICVCASIYLIISVGIERYLAVCRPHHFRQVQGQHCR